MSTPYGGNDPQQQPQWGQQPGYGQQPGGAQPPSGPQQQPQWGQQPQYDPSQTQQQQPQWGQQPGYPQSGPQQQPQWGQQPQQYDPSQQQYGQQPGYPQSGPQQQPGYPQSGPQQQPQYGQPQQGQYDYGQFAGAQGEVEEKPKSKKGLFIGIGALVVIIAAVGVLGFVTPGWFNTQVFNNTQMQTDVQKLLTETYQIPEVTAVSCPSGKEVKDGEKFTCTATIAGKPQEVPITVKGDTGNYEVSPPAVPK